MDDHSLDETLLVETLLDPQDALYASLYSRVESSSFTRSPSDWFLLERLVSWCSRQPEETVVRPCAEWVWRASSTIGCFGLFRLGSLYFRCTKFGKRPVRLQNPN